MKKMLLIRMALLNTGCAQQTFTWPKQTGSSTKGNHHPSFLRFWNWAEENCDAAKICGGAENVVKTETQQTFVNGLLGFITLGIYTPLGAVCIAHNNYCMSCPSDMGNSICTAQANYTSGFLPVVLHLRSTSLRVK